MTHIQSNDFGVITIPSTHNHNCNGTDAWCYDAGCDAKATVLNLQPQGKALQLLPEVSDEVIQYLTSYMTDEEMASEETRTNEYLFLRSLYWIWGNEDAGGVYMRKRTREGSVGYAFGVYQGKVTYTEGQHQGDHHYSINESWGSRADTEALREVAFFLADIDGDYTNPYDLYVMYKNHGTTITEGVLDSNGILSAVWIWTTGGSVSSATRNYAWSDDWSITDPFEFQAVPIEPWYGNDYQRINSEQRQGGIFTGEWTGGKEVSDPSEGGNSDDGGGDGGFGTNTDYNTGADPESMTIDAISSGMVTLYNPSASAVKQFSHYLFGGDITDAIANQLKRLISNPYDYIVFLAMCHFHPNNRTTSDTIKFVGLDTLIGSDIVAKQYQKVGNYVLLWDSVANGFDSYLDSNPYTKVELYLPYIGFVQINADDISSTKNSGPVKLTITYHVDLLTGSCIVELCIKRGARVRSGNADTDINMVRYNWNGNVYQMMPLSSNDFRGLFTAVTQFAGGVGSFITGNPIGGLGSMASAVISQKSTVNKNVPNATSYGYLNVQTPFLVVDRPIQSLPVNVYDGVTYHFKDYEGYPSNEIRKVREFTGYLETDPNTIWSNDINVLDSEFTEIQELFNTGVWV